jgi:MFS family permease
MVGRGRPADASAARPDGAAAGRGLLLLVAAAFFMENLDATIVTTAAPAIARSLRVEASDVGVTITAYLVTVAAVIPASGWVTGRWGARRTFGLAVVLFTAASGACALCTTLPELTAARVVQGIGGALMVPVGRLTVFRSTDRRDLVRVVAWMTWPALVAPVVAPLIGGVLVTYLSWPWIFAVNVPLGVVALAVTGRLIPDDARDETRRLDVVGLVLTAAALGTVVFAAEASAAPTQRWVLIGAFAASGLILGAWSVRHLRRVVDPLVDLSALRIRTFRVPHAGGAVFRAAVFAVPFLLVLEFQNGFHWSPVRSGTFVMFVFFGNVAIKPATTRILRRLGFRSVLLVSVTV